MAPLTSLLRFGEVAVGACAVVLPLAVSLARSQPRAELTGVIALAGSGCLALAVVAWWGSQLARSVVAGSVVGSAFVFGPHGGVVLLCLDAVALLAFLLLGGWVEAGARVIGGRARVAEATRAGFGVVAICVVAVATRLSTPDSLWLVLGAMGAGLAALLLARGEPT